MCVPLPEWQRARPPALLFSALSLGAVVWRRHSNWQVSDPCFWSRKSETNVYSDLAKSWRRGPYIAPLHCTEHRAKFFYNNLHICECPVIVNRKYKILYGSSFRKFSSVTLDVHCRNMKIKSCEVRVFMK